MLGRVVSPLVNVIDVDGIVQRIDVNELIERIDWNKLLESVDLDRALDRVDLNRILQRVDLNDLVERAEIPAIVARSASGIFSPLMDSFRSQVVMVDQAVQGSGFARKQAVPPAPGRPLEDAPKLPKGAGNIAVAVQQRYAGTMSRVLAFLLDQFIISLLFFLVVTIVGRVVEVATRQGTGDVDISEQSGLLRFFLYFMWQFVYYASALAATSGTPGKAILGLKVVNCEDGTPVKVSRAIVRTLLLTVSIWSVVGVVCGLIRKDRREFHDLVAGTGVVYSWDARMARYRQQQVEEAQGLVTGAYIASVSADAPREKRGGVRGLFRRRTKQKHKSDEMHGEENSMRSQQSQVMHL
jgi:uncharacterized RDD family membrane protein YckC